MNKNLGKVDNQIKPLSKNKGSNKRNSKKEVK